MFDLLDDAACREAPNRLDIGHLPDDLLEKTTVYEAITVLRHKVEQAGNDPNAASAAWHAEPYIGRPCAEFGDPIQSIRFDDGHFVIDINFPAGSQAYER